MELEKCKVIRTMDFPKCSTNWKTRQNNSWRKAKRHSWKKSQIAYDDEFLNEIYQICLKNWKKLSEFF